MSYLTLNEQFVSAARDGDLRELKELLSRGADPCFEHSMALIEAAKGYSERHEPCVEFLLLHCDPAAGDFLALRSAIGVRRTSIISLLLPSFTGFMDPQNHSKAFQDVIRIGHRAAFDTFWPLTTDTSVYPESLDAAVIYGRQYFALQLLEKILHSNIDIQVLLEGIRSTQVTLKNANLREEEMELSHWVECLLEARLLEQSLPTLTPEHEQSLSSKKKMKSL